MIGGINLDFKFRMSNDDGTPIKHSDFLDVIFYVYVFTGKIVKFSKSDLYNSLALIDDYYLGVNLSPEQTLRLGEGIPKWSIYVSIPATGYATGKLVKKGAGILINEPFVFDPISPEP